ncbi:MAG TPA: multiheme c-type cytochrome [Vicinamibacterales bacterium]|nr:multiheme c-type cytochrome [Vicinamibacterales bacterium]
MTTGRAVGPRLRRLLAVVLAGAALLFANSIYLAAITFVEWATARPLQNYFYQYMFLAHLVLGLAILVPFLVFVALHVAAAWRRRNRLALRTGYALGASSLALLLSGLVLVRFGFFEIHDPRIRAVAYWCHAILPAAAALLYVWHREKGGWFRPARAVASFSGVAVAATALLIVHASNPHPKSGTPKEGEKFFSPSLVRTNEGRLLPLRVLTMNEYCRTCHADAYEGWFHSAHRFSSFNNPFYLASVKETRQVVERRDGNNRGSRWCAGCHDPVPLLSGTFDTASLDEPIEPTGQAGITCTVCHGITQINTTRGNGDYLIEEPLQYPFAFSTNRLLQYVNRQLVKAKPAFHKRTYLKPVHRTAEFCSACHKVHIPADVTKYKDFLRGQNHYDPFLLSAASGHGARSFYYPPSAPGACAACHMPLAASSDFGARMFEGASALSIHDHRFAAANTALPFLRHDDTTLVASQSFLAGVARVDLFGLKTGGTIDGALRAPIRPSVPALRPGATYLLETVVRTLKVGHPLTQGTGDSNELWLDVVATSGGRTIGRNGALDEGVVDPRAHFINVYMLDREGRRVDRRNVQDIFVPLYDHQIPPSAAAVVHYELKIPAGVTAPVEVEVKLQYRKFTRFFTEFALGQRAPSLPVTTIASDRVVFPIDGGAAEALALRPDGLRSAKASAERTPAEWERWNDYGIGLLLEGTTGSEKGELRQAADAFAEVERLGRGEGPLNLARVFYKEGRLDEAADALHRAAAAGAPPWTVAWLSGLVNKENGFLDQAIDDFTRALAAGPAAGAARRFDFTLDYDVINELGQALFERAKMERGPAHAAARRSFLERAAAEFERTLTIDAENVTAHYALSLIYGELDDRARSAEHAALHARYKPDDNARDHAVAVHRLANEAANHAAQSIVIYPLR